MTNEAPPPTTYFHQALIDTDAPGGRYRGRGPHVTGTEPTVTPLAVPDWCIDPVPTEPPVGASADSASTEAEGMAEDVSSLLPSDAMPDASVIDEADEPPPEPTYLGTLSSIGRRRDFHMVSEEE
jgi:hypothetical protein